MVVKVEITINFNVVCLNRCMFIPSGPFMLSCIGLYTFLLFIMLYPVPAIDSFLEVKPVFLVFLLFWVLHEVEYVVFSSCCSASPQIVCVPHDWRITLVVIVVVNATVSFMLEVHVPRHHTPQALCDWSPVLENCDLHALIFFPPEWVSTFLPCEWNQWIFLELFLSLCISVAITKIFHPSSHVWRALSLKFPLKSPIDFDPWHHPVEASFQRQSGGKSPLSVPCYCQTSGREAFHYTLLCFAWFHWVDGDAFPAL